MTDRDDTDTLFKALGYGSFVTQHVSIIDPKTIRHKHIQVFLLFGKIIKKNCDNMFKLFRVMHRGVTRIF